MVKFKKRTLQTNIAVNGPYDTTVTVGITQSSVIQIIHDNVGLKRLPKFLLLSLIFAYIYISQGSVKTHLPCAITTLLQIVCRVCQCKNFENRSITGEDTNKSKVTHFLWPTVYV